MLLKLPIVLDNKVIFTLFKLIKYDSYYLLSLINNINNDDINCDVLSDKNNKSQKTIDSGNIIKIQGYEHFALDELLQDDILEEDIINGCKNTAYVDQVVKPLPIVQPLSGSVIVCEGASINLLSNVSVGLAPYQFTIISDSASVASNTAGILFAKKGGLATIFYKVSDAYGCVSENSAPFKIKVYDLVKPKIIYQEAFYDFNTIIKTKVDSGYSVYDWSPKMNLNYYNDKDPVFRGYNDVSYTLNRQDTTSNCSVADTYNITVTTNFIFDLPNAFTPNFDGLNDVIKSVYNSGIASLNFLKIYNRKGNIVFQTSLLSAGWDGRLNGVDQESDAYYWTAEYVTKKNETFRKSGSFLLIK
jgi:gliding motility-associated-like protein